KKEEATRDIPIIFLTALPDQESELNGLNLGAVDYIRKPLSIPMVQARLAIHLELARSRKELAKRNEMLEEVVRLRDDIERITRHDMKGPLSAVIGFSEVVLEEAGLSEYHADCLQRSIHAANRMLEMINRSMDLYKIETGRYRYEPHSFDLCRVVNRVCHDLSALVRSFQVEMVVDVEHYLAGEGCGLAADQMLCYFLLANLIKNAVEASPPGARVMVTLDFREEAWAHIRIHNVGEVPLEMQEHFFEKYKTFGKDQGTGLGTYSALLMARAQGGDVRMQSSRETGTRVVVSLPRVHE
ncbi:MAG: hybrid sensor histidine kinase/response regulator, partial [Magnetococcales bacterium]|nr:hybrid sensor histidine kinase/response regulator [Magnetococcales bacterium]